MTIPSDAWHATRRLAARPGFLAVALGSLALGIAANAVTFSLAAALLARSAPFLYPDRIVFAWFTPPGDPGARILATDANCAAIRERARSFAHVGCVLPGSTATIAPMEGAEGSGAARLSGQEFTAGVAEALRTAPALGRWFTADEERSGEPVMVISHRVWRQRFGADPAIIGRRVRVTNQGLRSETVAVVGVADPRFQLLDAGAGYWLPFPLGRGGLASPARRLLVVGRLRDEVSLAQAQADLEAIARALAEEMPRTNTGWGIRAESLPSALERGRGRPLLILQAAVLLVLLIACANVAGLLLSDGVARRGEMAVRAAVGATRGRLARQWLTESALIAGAGAALGLAVAWAALDVLARWLAPGFPALEALSLDAPVLAFTVALTVLTTLLIGMVPAVQAARANVSDLLTRSGRTAAAAPPGQRLRGVFVVAQVAIAVVLTIGAGLLVHSLARLRAVDPGVDTRGLATFQVSLDGRDYIRDTGQWTPSGALAAELTPRLFDAAARIREGLEALPGVEAATAMAGTPPLSGAARRYGLAGDAIPAAADGQPAPIEWYAVLPGYLRTLGVPLRAGRDLEAADSAAGQPVAVVSESLAAELWPGGDPIGREIQLDLFNDPGRQVVGVARDVRQAARGSARPRQVYVPFAQVRPIQSGGVAHGLEQLTFVVRAREGQAGLTDAFRRTVAAVEPSRPVTAIQPLDAYVAAQQEGFVPYVLLLGVFAAAAAVLALVGTYGLVAHAVRLRTGELGIRLALGASRGQALRLVLRDGLTLAGLGVALGVAGALALTRVLEGLLWEVQAADPLTFAGAALALGGAAALASALAARRALAIDPAEALRGN